jgi:hypothetical protein
MSESLPPLPAPDQSYMPTLVVPKPMGEKRCAQLIFIQKAEGWQVHFVIETTIRERGREFATEFNRLSRFKICTIEQIKAAAKALDIQL